MPITRRLKTYVLCAAASLSSACATAQDVATPDVVSFGATPSAMSAALEPYCTNQDMREINPPFMPGVSTQTQIDCEGFVYFGAPRLAEFVFADDALSLVWILTEKEEEAALIEAFRAEFGEPSHDTPLFTAFVDSNVAVRKDVPEALYYATTVDSAFREWFDQQAAGN